MVDRVPGAPRHPKVFITRQQPALIAMGKIRSFLGDRT
jgi:hypothetical protein